MAISAADYYALDAEARGVLLMNQRNEYALTWITERGYRVIFDVQCGRLDEAFSWLMATLPEEFCIFVAQRGIT